jgi:rhodanese-related sulfurtransferase
MKKMWVLIGLLASLTLLAAACGPGSSAPEETGATAGELSRDADGYADITAEQLAGILENTDLTLVNVHIPYEGEIPQTDLFIPFDEIADHVGQLPDKDALIVLYCRSGSMSTSAAQELVALGYTHVLEVDGGFNAWQAAGYELLHGQ